MYHRYLLVAGTHFPSGSIHFFLQSAIYPNGHHSTMQKARSSVISVMINICTVASFLFPRYELRKHVKSRHAGQPIELVKLELDYSFSRENQGEGPLAPNFKTWQASVKREPTENIPAVKETKDDDSVILEEPTIEAQKPVDLNTLHFNCFHCNFKAKSMMEFAQHVKTHDVMGKSGTSSETGSVLVQGASAASGKPGVKELPSLYKCSLCKFSTEEYSDFQTHRRTAHQVAYPFK